MSYDVDVAGDSFNYTWNLSHFFRDFGASPNDWDGRNRFEVADDLDLALARIELEDIDDLRAKYDPDNKWGNVETAIAWLAEIRDSCRKEIPAPVDPEVVRVS